ncbi:MAG: uncharacterized protein JWR82_1320 [Blastococcus sp.]|nr:uncharacterized protein [Blastococcus sp.]
MSTAGAALLATLAIVGIPAVVVGATDEGRQSFQEAVGRPVASTSAPADGRPLAALEGALVVEDSVGGQRVLTVTSSRPVSGPRPVALVLHGAGQDRRVPVEQSAEAFTQTLIDAGWIVASSDAGGDAWGSAASQAAYGQLLDRLRDEYPVSGVVLVSLSMGGIAGLNMVAAGSVPDLLGWVGVTPVTNLAAMAADPRFTDLIRRALSAEEASAVDPLAVPVHRLQGVPLVAVVSPSDPWTPPAAQLAPFADRLAAVNPVRVLECHDGHVGVDCYRADVVLELAAG